MAKECGCGKSGIVQDMPLISGSSPTTEGGYELALYQDCTTLHRGQHQGKAVYVVARGTVDERLFKFTQLAEASTYSRDVRGYIESLPTAALCDEAVVDVYG